MGELSDDGRWSWESNDTDIRVGYYTMQGRVTLAEFVEHMRKIAPWAAPEEIEVNFGTVRVRRPATSEELAQREQRWARDAARREEYERRELARLMEKYDIIVPYN